MPALFKVLIKAKPKKILTLIFKSQKLFFVENDTKPPWKARKT